MRARRHALCLSLVWLLEVSAAWAQIPAPVHVSGGDATGWIAQAEVIEAFLPQAEVVRIEDIGTGVTNPERAFVAPGGPVDSFSWKALAPGVYRGYRESYKAEIAAYQLDKLLNLHMVPVTVERRIGDELGSAQMWLSPADSFRDLGGLPTPPTSHLGMWNLQLIRAKMFDNLIYNVDPNEGNWMVDPSWNIFLIDHSRAFTARSDELVHEMTRVDRDLWRLMEALDEAMLTDALGEWLSPEETRALIERRDLMKATIDQLVAAVGADNVFVQAQRLPLGTEPLRQPFDIQARNLAKRVADAIETVPFLPPASVLAWGGTVVTLEGYAGPKADAAARARANGCTLGLVSDTGLVCLMPEARNSEPYDALEGLVGQQVEVMGIATIVNGTTSVEVATSRTAD